MSVSEDLLTLERDGSTLHSKDDRADHRRVRDVSMLLLAIAVIVLSLTLRIRADQRVELPGLSGFPVPETCGSRFWFGLDCPGCGLTRSFIRLASGDWSSAVALNRVSPLMALAVLVQIPYRLASLRAWPPARRFGASAWSSAAGWLLVAALVGNWLLKLSKI